MDIKTSVIYNGRVPITVLTPVGNIDVAAFETFMSKAEEAIRKGARHILVDMTDVPYMSSAGLRAFSAVFNKLRALDPSASEADVLQAIREGKYKSPHLKILNLSKLSRIAFETAGFDMFLETYDDLQEALESF